MAITCMQYACVLTLLGEAHEVKAPMIETPGQREIMSSLPTGCQEAPLALQLLRLQSLTKATQKSSNMRVRSFYGLQAIFWSAWASATSSPVLRVVCQATLKPLTSLSVVCWMMVAPMRTSTWPWPCWKKSFACVS